MPKGLNSKLSAVTLNRKAESRSCMWPHPSVILELGWDSIVPHQLSENEMLGQSPSYFDTQLKAISVSILSFSINH